MLNKQLREDNEQLWQTVNELRRNITEFEEKVDSLEDELHMYKKFYAQNMINVYSYRKVYSALNYDRERLLKELDELNNKPILTRFDMDNLREIYEFIAIQDFYSEFSEEELKEMMEAVEKNLE